MQVAYGLEVCSESGFSSNPWNAATFDGINEVGNEALFRYGLGIYTFYFVQALGLTEAEVIILGTNSFEIQDFVCPSPAPTFQPSPNPSPEPTAQLSSSPSVAPSSSICPITLFINRTYYFPILSFPGTCWRIELFDGGELSIDYDHESCSKTGFNDGTVFGNYIGFDEAENTVTFSDKGTSYVFQIRQFGNISEIGIDIIDIGANRYVFEAIVQRCNPGQ